MRNSLLRTAHAVFLSFLHLQVGAFAADPSVIFRCTAEQATYHYYDEDLKKWKVSSDQDDTAFIIRSEYGTSRPNWYADRLINETSASNTIMGRLECGKDFIGSYLVCKSGDEIKKEMIRFNILTMKFDYTDNSTDWLARDTGFAMLYIFGACQKLAGGK